MNKAIFLDRDGTLIKDKEYQFISSEIEFIEGVTEALNKFLSLGFKLIVITNQSGIGRGYYNVEDMNSINRAINDELSKDCISIIDFYHCPHFLGSEMEVYNIQCSCRKPAPGLLIQAAKDYDIDLSQSYMIGDKESDVLAGENAGVKNSYLINGKQDLLYYAELIHNQSFQLKNLKK